MMSRHNVLKLQSRFHRLNSIMTHHFNIATAQPSHLDLYTIMNMSRRVFVYKRLLTDIDPDHYYSMDPQVYDQERKRIKFIADWDLKGGGMTWLMFCGKLSVRILQGNHISQKDREYLTWRDTKTLCDQFTDKEGEFVRWFYQRNPKKPYMPLP